MLLKIFYVWLLTVVLTCVIGTGTNLLLYLDDSDDFEEVNKEMMQNAELGIYNGGTFGKLSKKNYLPSAYADFFYESCVEEYGLLGVNLLFSLMWIPVLVCLLLVGWLHAGKAYVVWMRKLNLAHVVVVLAVIGLISLALWLFRPHFFQVSVLWYGAAYGVSAVLCWRVVFREERKNG